MLKLS
jgi:serine/threonine protein kinase